MIGGVFSPTVTAMSNDGIDVQATRRHIQRLVASGVHGLCPGGSGGEFVGLTYEERQQIISLSIQASAGRIPVYAGTGCYSTRDTIRLSRWAEAEGADLFAKLTEENLNKTIAIYLDGSVISAPRVQSVITDGKAVITGRFSIDEAKQLVRRLNSGALPVPIELISQQTVGPTLGAESLSMSTKAGILSVVLVSLFMILL